MLELGMSEEKLDKTEVKLSRVGCYFYMSLSLLTSSSLKIS